jgi:hypothetical protein
MGPAFHASEQPVIVNVEHAQPNTNANPNRDITRFSSNVP